MNSDWSVLYGLQDWALSRLRKLEHGFYLTGGTALSRGYFDHRYSEDLDFFANDAPEFGLWRDRCLDVLRRAAEEQGHGFEVVLRDARFGRALVRGGAPLKIEFVNDVPFRIGLPWRHPDLGLLDTKENILANKVSALVDRREPKDVADIFWLCCRDRLSLGEAVENASGKAAGIFPPLVAKALIETLPGAWESVRWREAPGREEFESGVKDLADGIMRGGG